MHYTETAMKISRQTVVERLGICHLNRDWDREYQSRCMPVKNTFHSYMNIKVAKLCGSDMKHKQRCFQAMDGRIS